MIAVWSKTGRPFRVGDRTFDPVLGTLLDDLDEATRRQAPNLRTMEVTGRDDPTLQGMRLHPAEGEDAGKRTVVPVVEHETVVAELDAAKADLQAATTAKDQAETSLRELREQIEASADPLKDPPAPVDPNPALEAAIDAVLTAPASTLERLPEDALGKLAAVKSVDPIPEGKKELVEALKAAA